MGYEFRYRCLVETRRLLLLMGVGFAFILFFQYLELPYSTVMSSLFSTGESQVPPTFNSSRNSERHSGLNSPGEAVVGVPVPAEVVGGNVSHTENFEYGFDPENETTFDDSSNDIDPEDESPPDFLEMIHNSTNWEKVLNDTLAPIKPNESDNHLPISDNPSKSSKALEQKEEYIRNSSVLQTNLPLSFQSPQPSIFMNSSSPNMYSAEKSEENIFQVSKNHGSPQGEITPSVSDSSGSSTPNVKGKVKGAAIGVVPISKMNDLLLQSHVSYRGVKPRWSSPVDQELLNIKNLIDNAPVVKRDPNFDVTLYRNFSAFKRSYELMEQTLKVYIYAEGESPVFHRPPLKGIYASEGWFMKQMKASKRFTTKNPQRAHLFYFPFSSRALEMALYTPNSHNRGNLVEYLSKYLNIIKGKHPFWNRTDGADHFLVACHDWAPYETRNIMANCIRSLCNADIRGGFKFGKDASLPEVVVKTPQNPLRQLGGKPASRRPILAFFAGNMHGYLRPILLNYWKEDPDMKIFGQLRKVKGEMSYAQYMKSSKYCICAKGYEVNSPRVVESIFYECIPVIISDNFVPPFFQTLDWESFAVFVLEKDIPNLKKILQSISKKRYIKMQQRVKQVQQHFLWHSRPEKYDVFHMILHSVWHNRLLQARSW